MKRIRGKTDIFNVLRLTTSFGNETRLKSNTLPDRALKRLSEYENTGFTPLEILQMKETIFNLQERIKKMEAWQ